MGSDPVFSYARGRMRGISPGVLRGPRFDKPFRGVRADASSLEEPWLRMRSAALLLPPGGALTGWSSLVARGVPLSWIDGRGPDREDLPVRVEIGPETQIRKRAGLDVVRRGGSVVASTASGLLVASAPVAWLVEIERRSDQVNALVVTDAVLRYGLASVDELAELLARSTGMRGVTLARWALDLADPYAETPKETEYRWRWVETGLGRPLANRVILDERGRFVARTDLVDDDAGVAGEFNGRWHRAGLQPWSDETRLRGLRRTGLEVAVTGEPDLRDEGRGARAVVVDTYALASRRPPDARRWRVGPPPPLPFQRAERDVVVPDWPS
jgi:hypothetical protein